MSKLLKKFGKKGKIINGVNPNVYRKDDCNAWIKRDEYGNREVDFGWEIDHITPNNDDSLLNLRPLQWQNNLDKSDGKLKCNVTSNGNRNILKNSL